MAVLVIFLASIMLLDSSFALKIGIVPEKFTGKDGDTVTISCTPNEKEATATEILTMTVARKGETTVVLHPNNTLSYPMDNKGEYESTGVIKKGGNISNSFLNLLIKTPSSEDTGGYRCFIFYMNSVGWLMRNTATANLTVDDTNVKILKDSLEDLQKMVKADDNVLNMIERKDKEIEGKVKDLEENMDKNNKELKDLVEKQKQTELNITNLKDKTTKQFKDIQDSDVEVENLKQIIANLVEKVENLENKMTKVDGAQAYHKELLKIKEKLTTSESIMSDLEEKESSVMKKVNDIVVKTTNQIEQLKKLSNDVKTADSTIISLKSKYLKFENSAKQTQVTKTEILNNFTRLEAETTQIKSDVKSLVAYNKNHAPITTPTIYFIATNLNVFLKPTTGSTLIFPDIVSQTGSGYSSKTGLFTAPYEGLYAFNLNLKLSCTNCYARVVLTANSKILLKLKVGNVYDQDSNSASTVVKLEKDQTVKLYVDDAKNPYLTYAKLCTYSGYLIHQI